MLFIFFSISLFCCTLIIYRLIEHTNQDIRLNTVNAPDISFKSNSFFVIKSIRHVIIKKNKNFLNFRWNFYGDKSKNKIIAVIIGDEYFDLYSNSGKEVVSCKVCSSESSLKLNISNFNINPQKQILTIYFVAYDLDNRIEFSETIFKGKPFPHNRIDVIYGKLKKPI